MRTVGARFQGGVPGLGVQGQELLLATLVFPRVGEPLPSFEIDLAGPELYASFVTIDGSNMDRDVDGLGPLVLSMEELPLDSDRGGIPAPVELAWFENLTQATATSDSDGDGTPDIDEWIGGTDPKDPNSATRLVIQMQTDGSRRLVWNARGGRVYDLLKSTDLRTFVPIAEGLTEESAISVFDYAACGRGVPAADAIAVGGALTALPGGILCSRLLSSWFLLCLVPALRRQLGPSHRDAPLRRQCLHAHPDRLLALGQIPIHRHCRLPPPGRSLETVRRPHVPCDNPYPDHRCCSAHSPHLRRDWPCPEDAEHTRPPTAGSRPSREAGSSRPLFFQFSRASMSMLQLSSSRPHPAEGGRASITASVSAGRLMSQPRNSLFPGSAFAQAPGVGSPQSLVMKRRSMTALMNSGSWSRTPTPCFVICGGEAGIFRTGFMGIAWS